jgi:hypothetical protein
MAGRSASVHRFKITLQGIVPAVWRRIEVPSDYSFWDLHVAIQDAMGWTDSHLHVFRVGEEQVGIPDEDAFEGDAPYLPGWEIRMDEYFTEAGDVAPYEYDFGDGWEHEVLLEEIAPRAPKTKYPRCLAGERACPPEDCGGVPGYENMLEILADPDHEEHADTVQWVGGAYDPGRFDPEIVRFDDPKKRWKTAFGDR